MDEEVLALARALLQAPSPSGEESPAARVLCDAFEMLGFDESYTDEAGNAIGAFRRGDGPALVFNGHMDTVPLGDEALWPHPPLAGEVAEGRLWGRGACDMKSALACMAYAAADAARAGFSGTLLVTGVVQEEVGGLGARYLGEQLKADVVILGEPSKLKLMLGHRGRVEVHATLPGKIAHAAKNELGDNALYHAADLLEQLRDLELPKGGPLQGSSLTPTWLRSQPQDSANVVPGGAKLVLDYRNIPGDEPEDILARLQKLAPEAHFELPSEFAHSENGKIHRDFPCASPPYLTPSDSPWITRARQVIKRELANCDRPLAEDCWWFSTDAPHLAKTGAVVIGFGPGEEELAHTTQESVPLSHLSAARRVYAALALAASNEQ